MRERTRTRTGSRLTSALRTPSDRTPVALAGPSPITGGIGRSWPLLALFLVLASAAYVGRVRHEMVDFSVNHQAGQRLARGETLYQTSDGHYMFKYLPASALVYLPLGMLPLDAAKPIWFAISLAALLLSFRVVRQLVQTGGARYLWIIPALILAKYVLRELSLGQINLLVTLVMLCATLAMVHKGDPRADMAAGALVGVATALKPYAAVLFVYLAVTGRWRGAASGLAVLLAALTAPALFYGIEGNVRVLGDWAATLAESTPNQLTNNDNVSVWAFFMKWMGDPTRTLAPTLAVIGVLAATMLWVIVRGRGLPRAAVLEMAMLLTLIPLVSPMGWDYTFVMALMAVTLIVANFAAFPQVARVILALNFAAIALTIYDVMGRQAYATFMQWSVTTINFVIVVAATAYLRAIKKA
jgi:alpha-1,2-mannosyltransferase